MKGLSKLVFQIFVGLGVLVGLNPLALTTSAPTLKSAGQIRFLIQTTIGDPVKLSALSRWLQKNNFDVAGMKWHLGQVEVITTADGISFLKKQGLTGTTVQSESESLDPKYLNASTIEARLRQINEAYPKLTRLVKFGTSIQGRPMLALALTDTPDPSDPANNAKPTLLFDGVHHAREVMTAEVVADVADTILKAAKSSPTAQGLLHRWNIWLVPIVNMDGSNIVFNGEKMWRKNAHTDQSDVYGVDINRNYPYRWAGCDGSSNSPTADDFHGASAASEPETMAMVNLGNAIRPTASLSYHSYSELVLYPYGCHGEYTGEKELTVRIARELSAKLPTDDKRGNYASGTTWELLYDVDGSSMDYFYASFGTLAYTFEINTDFQPPYSQKEPTLAKERNAWGYFLSRIDQNLLHVIVVDSKTGQPAVSLIAINTIKNNKGEMPFKTNSAGHYFKVLDPGQYTIAAKLADGREGQMTVQMAGKAQTITLNVQ